ncbi:MAG: hypothetical protein WDW36_005494 [Sanguina aurantia]
MVNESPLFTDPVAQYAQARSVRAPSRVAGATQMEPLAPEPEEEDFDLLSDKIAVLQTQVLDELKGCSVWLIGMMGSGKSTTGKMLANTLRYSFIDTDTLIEAAHEKRPVADIFAQDGEPYFRKVESQVVRELSAYKSMVISTGGGAVLLPENWGYMHNGIVAWLSGEPSLLARRVAADGVSKRPLLATPTPTPDPFDGSSSSSSGSSGSDAPPTSSPASSSESASSSSSAGSAPSGSTAEPLSAVEARLSAMLADRTKFYENADIIIPLTGFGVDVESGAPTAVVMFRLLKSLLLRIQTTKAEREEKRKFTIEGAETQRTQPRSMRVVDTPAQAAAALAESAGETAPQAVITSYDYGAPINEHGAPTTAYHAFRAAIGKSLGRGLPSMPPTPTMKAWPPITAQPWASVWDNLPQPRAVAQPSPNELVFGQDHGMVLYRKSIPAGLGLEINGVHDYATVFTDGHYLDAISRVDKPGLPTTSKISLPAAAKNGCVLDILIDGFGHVGYGHDTTDRKGLTGAVSLDKQRLTDFDAYSIPLDAGYMRTLKPSRQLDRPGIFFRAVLHLDAAHDSYIDMSAWDKGYLWVNGHLLGRYWHIGPQQRLYCPASWLGRGDNEILVLDMHRTSPASLRGVATLEAWTVRAERGCRAFSGCLHTVGVVGLYQHHDKRKAARVSWET